MTTTISLKWNKNSYDNVTLDTTKPVSDFKATVFDLTNVPPERQKLMAKGAWPGILKDDADLNMMPIKNGQQVMLMGTANAVLPAKNEVTKVLFVEDMTAEQKAAVGAVIPAGFNNIGNTCYMNSVLQVFRHMGDLRETIRPLTSSTNPQSRLITTLNQTLTTLDKSEEPGTPQAFLYTLHSIFPQFAEVKNGSLMQQDAEEFYNALTQALNASLSSNTNSSSSSTAVAVAAAAGPTVGNSSHLSVQNLLQLEFDEAMECVESPDEPKIVRPAAERVFKLVCNIQGGSADSNISSAAAAATSIANKPINIMTDGIVLNMEGTIEKNSAVLQRNALWKKTQRISKLPRFICVQFMRFFWKETPDSREASGLKCKILRPVAFPDVFDVYPLCNDALQGVLKENRDNVNKAKDAAINASISGETIGAAASTSSTAAAPPAAPAATATATGGAAMETEDEEDDDAMLQAALAMSVGGAAATTTTAAATAALPSPPAAAAATKFSSNLLTSMALPADFTGHYELMGVVTHKGRSADSGHYIGWVREKEGSDKWWKFDDAVVSEVTTAEIMALKGGGDWHTAYLNFYRYKGGSTK